MSIINEANYWQTRGIARPLCDSRATCLLLLVWNCLVRCETWTKQEGVAAANGKFYPYTSLFGCLKLCLEMSTCVAVDRSSEVCVVHTNISDIDTTFNASEFTLYIVNRTCRLSTSTSVSSTVSTEAATQSSYFGIQCHFLQIIFSYFR